jgi:para-nitrobenzyl esterase
MVWAERGSEPIDDRRLDVVGIEVGMDADREQVSVRPLDPQGVAREGPLEVIDEFESVVVLGRGEHMNVPAGDRDLDDRSDSDVVRGTEPDEVAVVEPVDQERHVEQDRLVWVRRVGKGIHDLGEHRDVRIIDWSGDADRRVCGSGLCIHRTYVRDQVGRKRLGRRGVNRAEAKDRPNARVRRLCMAATASAAVLVLVGCTVPRPPGDPPLRYRDAVFSSVAASRDLSYGSAPDNDGNPVTLRLDLYQPSGDTVSRRPAIVYVHGGGFSHGDKSAGADFATYFAQRGYVAVSINYRLLAPLGCGGQDPPSPECASAALAAQHDAQAAVRWLRANASAFRVDPDRIGIAGASAGAITSLLVAWRSDDPGSSGNPGHSSAVRGAVSISGGTPTNEYINQGDAPAIFFHGTKDHVVQYDWAVSNAAAMLNTGIAVFLEPFEGAGHGLLADYSDVIYEQSDYFFYDFLDAANAEGGGQS